MALPLAAVIAPGWRLALTTVAHDLDRAETCTEWISNHVRAPWELQPALQEKRVLRRCTFCVHVGKLSDQSGRPLALK